MGKFVSIQKKENNAGAQQKGNCDGNRTNMFMNKVMTETIRPEVDGNVKQAKSKEREVREDTARSGTIGYRLSRLDGIVSIGSKKTDRWYIRRLSLGKQMKVYNYGDEITLLSLGNVRKFVNLGNRALSIVKIESHEDSQARISKIVKQNLDINKLKREIELWRQGGGQTILLARDGEEKLIFTARVQTKNAQ